MTWNIVGICCLRRCWSLCMTLRAMDSTHLALFTLFPSRSFSPLWPLAPMTSTTWPLTFRCLSQNELRTWFLSRAGSFWGSSSCSRGTSTERQAKPRPGPMPSPPKERERRSGSAKREWKKRRRTEKDRAQGRERFGKRWLSQTGLKRCAISH